MDICVDSNSSRTNQQTDQLIRNTELILNLHLKAIYNNQLITNPIKR